MTVEEITREALSLPETAREDLAQQLMESLTDSHEQAWQQEIDRRLDAYEKGQAEVLPGPEVMARVRRNLGL